MKKYKYHFLTWGGFYNEEYKNIHKFEPGDYLFDTLQEREEKIKTLEKVCKDLDARVLCISRSEGFNCDVRTVAHRISEFEGNQYYSSNDLGVNYPFEVATYIMEDKWYPGFNDYPLGENFNYDQESFKIVSEWITGAMEVYKIRE